MSVTTARHDDGTIELNVTLPWTDVDRTYKDVFDAISKQAQVPGFRKGKAPKKLVEDNIDSSKVYEEVVRQVVPKAYTDAVKQENLRPAVTPKVELVNAKQGEDWTLRFLTCEKPNLTLGDYKEAVRALKANKQKKIWTPGEKQDETEKKDQKPSLDDILMSVLTKITVTIPSIMLESEVTRLLSDLVDQVRKLGLTVEQYLASTNRTSDSLRAEYEAQAKRMISLELALEKIADGEHIFVSDDEIEAMIKSAKTEEEKRALEHDRYYLASVLRRQKTLDFLAKV